MARNRRGIRRVAVAATLAAVAAAPLALWIAPAGATVEPVGKVTLKITVTITEVISGNPTDVGPMTGTAKGTVDAEGHLFFSINDITFKVFSTEIIVPATLQIVPVSDWKGTIDPTSGTVLLSGDLQVNVSVDSLDPPLVDCPLGPSTWNLFGKGYSASNGKVTVSDPGFGIPALADGTPGCGGNEGLINPAVGLPGTGSVTANLTFSPILKGKGIVATTTTTKATTTTTKPVPVTVAAPPPTGLPRTGSSTMPLAIAGATFLAAGLALVVRRRPHALQ